MANGKQVVKRKATFVEALVPIVFLIVVLAVSLIKFGADPQIPLILGAAVAGLVGVFRLGFTWSELEDGGLNTIKVAMQSVLILMIVGALIGTWILSGTVPAKIYWGL